MLMLLCPHSYLTWELWVYFDEKLHILFTWQDYHPTWGLFLERPGKLSGPVITGSFEKQAPGDTPRTTRELPDVDSKLLRSVKAQNFSRFSLFTIWYGFWNYKSLFVNIWCRFHWEKLPHFNTFLVDLHWNQDKRMFPAYWILIGQFKFQARQPYARIDGRSYYNIQKADVRIFVQSRPGFLDRDNAY